MMTSILRYLAVLAMLLMPVLASSQPVELSKPGAAGHETLHEEGPAGPSCCAGDGHRTLLSCPVLALIPAAEIELSRPGGTRRVAGAGEGAALPSVVPEVQHGPPRAG